MLQEAIKHDYFNWRNFIATPSTARATREAGFSINREADPLSQLVTIVSRINKENELIKTNNLISDRTQIDSMAYTVWQYNFVWKDKNEYYLDQCRKLVAEHMRTYDMVFYFPPYWKPEADGVRDTDVEWQKNIDDFIVKLAKMMGVVYTEVPNKNVVDRAYWLEEQVQNKYNFPAIKRGRRVKPYSIW